LRDEGGKDYTSATASANELFGYIARQIASIIRPDRLYDMGHTFSFPCRQLAVDSARLITWTKEIRTAGVEGEDVGGIFARAMVDAGVNNVKQVAIINDTVGTLLAASHNFDNVDIGSICGTGHNTCYRELNPPMAGQPMIINMESGNFDKIRRTSWDEQLDRQSDLPGQQRLEKMCSGHYIGRLTGIVFADYLNKVGRLPLTGGEACARLCPDGADLSRIISDATPAADCSRATIADCWGESAARRLETEDYRALRAIAAAIKTRSARLVAATYLGTLQHIDPQFCQPHTIAIDGSLYEKLSGYVGDLRRAVDDNLPDGARPVRLILAKDGSGIGAAVAAAVAGVTRQAQ
ncbi:MAG: hexokinase, partial [Negativicutes bacterium]|nr:hexokinase [Negativicutes bacterium]